MSEVITIPLRPLVAVVLAVVMSALSVLATLLDDQDAGAFAIFVFFWILCVVILWKTVALA